MRTNNNTTMNLTWQTRTETFNIQWIMKHQKHHVWTKVKEALKELYQDMPINLHKPWYNEAEITLMSICTNKKNTWQRPCSGMLKTKPQIRTNNNDDTNTQRIACLTFVHWQNRTASTPISRERKGTCMTFWINSQLLDLPSMPLGALRTAQYVRVVQKFRSRKLHSRW